MPPLLPEYLSKPLQIVVEAPTTDWWPVILGAAATVGGAALGAYLGARYSYRATIKAQSDIDLVNKLEAIHSLALQSKLDIESLERKRGFNNANQHAAKPRTTYDIGKAVEEISSNLHKTKSLIEIYFDSSDVAKADIVSAYEAYLEANGNRPQRKPRQQGQQVESEDEFRAKNTAAHEAIRSAREELIKLLDKILIFCKNSLK
ncbi:hypothetical protein ACQKFL_11615 [Vreelandella titanicae]|uniref:hypothetical protein n=1 Tax=Vreelandella titanicae TaxID=664683 RepID=UPI003CFBCB88